MLLTVETKTSSQKYFDKECLKENFVEIKIKKLSYISFFTQ